MDENLELDTQAEEIIVEKSMDDTIRETLAEINARDESLEEKSEPAEKTETTEAEKSDKIRAPDGKFSKVETKDEPPIVPDTPVQNEPLSAEIQRLGLRKEEADAFVKADPKLREAFLRRSEEMHKGIEQYRETANFGQTMYKAVQPYEATLRSMGTSPEKAVQILFNADHQLRYGTSQQKAAMFSKLAGDYGIDLNQFTQVDQSQIDPNVKLALQRAEAAEQRSIQSQQYIDQLRQQDEQRTAQTLYSEIAKYSADPAYPHFEALRNEMAGLLQAGLASDLKEAYDKAIYANPVIRTQIIAKQQADSELVRKAEAAKKAAEAKKAAVINIPRKGTLNSKAPIGSMDQTIFAEAQRLGLIPN